MLKGFCDPPLWWNRHVPWPDLSLSWPRALEGQGSGCTRAWMISCAPSPICWTFAPSWLPPSFSAHTPLHKNRKKWADNFQNWWSLVRGQQHKMGGNIKTVVTMTSLNIIHLCSEYRPFLSIHRWSPPSPRKQSHLEVPGREIVKFCRVHLAMNTIGSLEG